MTGGQRIKRGALRLGTLAGVLVFLFGAISALRRADDRVGTKAEHIEQARCLAASTKPTLLMRSREGYEDELLFKENGCPGIAESATLSEIRDLVAVGRPAFLPTWHWLMFKEAGAAVFGWILIGVMVVALSWSIGWAISGFSADAK